MHDARPLQSGLVAPCQKIQPNLRVADSDHSVSVVTCQACELRRVPHYFQAKQPLANARPVVEERYPRPALLGHRSFGENLGVTAGSYDEQSCHQMDLPRNFSAVT
jgi:hypothetical protein